MRHMVNQKQNREIIFEKYFSGVIQVQNNGVVHF